MMARDQLPFLDEPCSVELANTRYGSGEDAYDFLDEPTLASWLHHAPHSVPAATMDADQRGSLRQLRNALADLYGLAVQGRRAKPAALSTISRCAQLCVPRAQLRWQGDRPVRDTVFEGTGFDRFLAVYAHDAADLCTSDRWDSLRRCAAEDCTMLFVQQHRRRRFCHPSCSQRVRQAAYHRRQRQRP